MYTYRQRNSAMDLSESGHQFRHGASFDHLTCGNCSKEFLLDNISQFIAHKAQGCTYRPSSSRRSCRPGDPGEDTPSPHTCSLCSRVFMNARDLVHHIQYDHDMAICLEKGSLVISGKEASAQPPHSMPSTSSSSTCLPPDNKFRSQERQSAHSSVAHHAQKRSKSLGMDDDDDGKRLPITRTLLKKHRYVGYEQQQYPGVSSQRAEQEVENPSTQPAENYPCTGGGGSPGEEFGKHEGRSPTDSTGKETDRGPPRDDRGRDGGGRAGFEAARTYRHFGDGGGLGEEEEDSNSPICLVVGSDARSGGDQQESSAAADNAKNVKLKKLLMREAPPPPEHPRETSSPALPKSPAPDDELYDQPYGDSPPQQQSFHPHSSAVAAHKSRRYLRGGSSGSQQQQQQQQPPPQTFYVGSIEQSIDKIIRASVADEIEDLDISRDSMESAAAFRPHSSSSSSVCFSQSPAVLPPSAPSSSSSYQQPGYPLVMPSLIASHQLGGFLPHQPYDHSPAPQKQGMLGAAAGAGPVRSQSYTMRAATPPAVSPAPPPEKAVDILPPALYPVLAARDRLTLGYHSKASMISLGCGSGKFKPAYPLGVAPLYGKDVDLHHWGALAPGDGYSGSMPDSTRHTSEAPTNTTPQGMGEDAKNAMDGRMKKRRYPTSRPFKCAHCDQAFNQRIHLKKHMSKHTGVKPFKCQQCDYSTVERSHLKVHYRIHTGEKPYRCMFCDYATAQNSTLKIHMKRHHEGQQAVARDASNGRRDRHKALHADGGAESMREERDLSDSSSKMRDNFEGHDGHHLQIQPQHQPPLAGAGTFDGRNSEPRDLSARRMPVDRSEGYPRPHAPSHPAEGTALKQAAAERDLDMAPQPAYQPCPQRPRSPAQASPDTGGSGRDSGFSTPDRKTAYSREEHCSTAVWPEMMKSQRVGLPQVHRTSSSSSSSSSSAHQVEQSKSSAAMPPATHTGVPMFPRNVYAKRSLSDQKLEEEDPASPYNMSSENRAWKNLQPCENKEYNHKKNLAGETSKEAAAHCKQSLGSDKLFTPTADDHPRVGLEKAAGVEAATGESDGLRDDFSDDNGYLNCNTNLDSVTIPVKAFVRG